MPTPPMKLSAAGIRELILHEGVVLGPYLDSAGIWTYGVGHTAEAGLPDPSKMEKVDTKSWSAERVSEELAFALGLFEKDVQKYVDRVNDAVKVPLTQHEFDALVSFDYNTGGIYRAKLTKNINDGKPDPKDFLGWLKPVEIAQRRNKEMTLFMSGNYAPQTVEVPVYDVSAQGKLKLRQRMPMDPTMVHERAPEDTKPLAVDEFFVDSPTLSKPESAFFAVLGQLLKALLNLFGSSRKVDK